MSRPRTATPGAMPVPSTASTPQLYATIRKALLAHITVGGATLTDYLGAGDRVYVRNAPTPPIFPYVTLRLDRVSTAGYNGYREQAVLEVQCLGKPESQLSLVEAAVDIIDDCLLRYTYAATDGLMSCRTRQRQTIPLFTEPADAGVVAVVANYDLWLWPRVLTSRAD